MQAEAQAPNRTRKEDQLEMEGQEKAEKKIIKVSEVLVRDAERLAEEAEGKTQHQEKTP